MKKLMMLPIAALLMAGALACANPADNAPDAVVEEPAAAPAAEETVADTGEAATYAFADGSAIGFVGSKVTGSHEGGFESFDGWVSVNGTDLTTTQVNVTIDTDSLWSDNDNLTGHLKSADFFDVATYPTSTFESTGVVDNGDGTYTVTGNLELHGVTKQISFPANITLDDTGMAVQTEFSINRFDFEIVYPGKTDDLIREEVLIKLDLKAQAASDEMPMEDAASEEKAA